MEFYASLRAFLAEKCAFIIQSYPNLDKESRLKKFQVANLQILKQSLKILKGERRDSYSLVSLIHAVTVFPVFCLNAALKVL